MNRWHFKMKPQSINPEGESVLGERHAAYLNEVMLLTHVISLITFVSRNVLLFKNASVWRAVIFRAKWHKGLNRVHWHWEWVGGTATKRGHLPGTVPDLGLNRQQMIILNKSGELELFWSIVADQINWNL